MMSQPICRPAGEQDEGTFQNSNTFGLKKCSDMFLRVLKNKKNKKFNEHGHVQNRNNLSQNFMFYLFMHTVYRQA